MTTWANANYLRPYFGVSQAEASRTGYRPVSPGGGIRDVRASLALVHQFNAADAVVAAASTIRWIGELRDMPVASDPSGTTIMLVLSWRL